MNMQLTSVFLLLLGATSVQAVVGEPQASTCKVGEWSEWSKCNYPCGTGATDRKRTTEGTNCPHDREMDACNTDPCDDGSSGMSPAEAQKAMEELENEFADAKDEMGEEVDVMREDMLDSNENGQDLGRAAEVVAKEQRTEETMIQDENAMKDLKFHEKEVKILQSPHEQDDSSPKFMEHGFFNGKLSPERVLKHPTCNGCPEYCPGPILEKCRGLVMGGPKCVQCMHGLSVKCLKVQENTMCWATGGDSDYSVHYTDAFDAAVRAGRPVKQAATERTLLRKTNLRIQHNNFP